jgi:hypothetical protein
VAENSKNTPDYEYSKVDVSITINFRDGDFPLANRFESMTFTPNPQAGTMKGSGRTPRSHTATRYEPELTIVLDKDTADYITKRAGKRAVKSVTVVRQRPDDSPVTDVYHKWMPQDGDTEYGDDATQVEVTGNVLGWDKDKQSKIVVIS